MRFEPRFDFKIPRVLDDAPHISRHRAPAVQKDRAALFVFMDLKTNYGRKILVARDQIRNVCLC